MKPYFEEGGITIYHGDCRTVLPALDQTVDLIVTDPPYGISMPGISHERLPGRGSRTLDFFENDTPKQATELMLEAWRQTLRLCSDSASAYWWVGHRTFGRLVDAYECEGWKTRFLVWSKLAPAPPPPGSGWPSAAELCVYASRPGRTWNHDCISNTVPHSNVFLADSYRHGQPGKNGHPTQKPLAVITPLLLASCLPGGIVLDPFAGSGTTLEAAKKAGCRAIGIDIEERWCEIAASRLSQGVLAF